MLECSNATDHFLPNGCNNKNKQKTHNKQTPVFHNTLFYSTVWLFLTKHILPSTSKNNIWIINISTISQQSKSSDWMVTIQRYYKTPQLVWLFTNFMAKRKSGYCGLFICYLDLNADLTTIACKFAYCSNQLLFRSGKIPGLILRGQ